MVADLQDRRRAFSDVTLIPGDLHRKVPETSAKGKVEVRLDQCCAVSVEAHKSRACSRAAKINEFTEEPNIRELKFANSGMPVLSRKPNLL